MSTTRISLLLFVILLSGAPASAQNAPSGSQSVAKQPLDDHGVPKAKPTEAIRPDTDTPLIQTDSPNLRSPLVIVTQAAREKSPQEESNWAKFATAIVWPVTIIVLVLLVAFSSRIARLLGLSAKVVKKIKAAGVEMEINAEAVDQVRLLLSDSFEELVSKARREYERMAELMSIYKHLERTVVESLPKVLLAHKLNTSNEGVRATVHVRDIVFAGYLYQLVDYYPGRTGAGRRFSQRYGIIGRSWRLDESLGEGDALIPGNSNERALIAEWGMIRQEAQSTSRANPSYLSIILRDDNSFPLGVLFIDSPEKNKFGDKTHASQIAESLEKDLVVQSLAKALDQALAPLRLAAPNLNIEGYK